MTPEQERTIRRLHKFIVIGMGIAAFNLTVVFSIQIYKMLHPVEVRYVTLPAAQDGPEHYPEMSRGALTHAGTPPLDVEVKAGGDSSSSQPLAGNSPLPFSESPSADPSAKLDGILNTQIKGERRARYDRLTPDQQGAFLLAAASYVERFRRDCQDWWKRAADMSDEAFLSDDTLTRLRSQLGQDLENLLPSP